MTTDLRRRLTRAAVLTTATVTALATVLGSSTAASAATASNTTPLKIKKNCAAPAKGRASCFSIRVLSAKQPAGLGPAVTPQVTPSGYGPSDLRSAYSLPSTGGVGQTIAIVDAQNDPNAESDLGVYRAQYGLPACTKANGCFSQVNQNGATSPLPANDTGWAGEISLDVDMASAICPSCKILLVEATSASMADLGAAVNRAVTMGAKYVSNSWGGGEGSDNTANDAAYFNHPGVAITVSSGDSGYGVEYPASSQYVTAVGGTSLVRTSNARGWTEGAWNGAGSGCSAYDPKPAQQNIVTTCARRAVADVSAVADPNTGVAVYQTYGASGWNVYGGTSVSAPIIAGVYALAGTPGASDRPNAYPYSHTANLWDVTTGSNGSCGSSNLCTSKAGWDGPTGLGTPNGVAAFAPGASTVTVTNPGSKSGTVGSPISAFTLTASPSAGYTWSAVGLPAGLSITTGGTVSGTPTTAGTFSTTVTASGSAGSGSTSFTFTIAAGGGACATGQKLGNPGFESGTAPWTTTSGVINANGSGQTSHSGTAYAWLDGYGTTHTDTLSQSVAIPAGCTNSTLAFYLHVDTAETTTTTQYDKLTVKIGSTTLATYSNLNKVTGYVLVTLPVGSYAGTTQTITFTGVEDSSLQTSFVIDDTALNAS